LSDGPFTVRAGGQPTSTITAGAPTDPDHVVEVSDGDLHLLLTGRLTPARRP